MVSVIPSLIGILLTATAGLKTLDVIGLTSEQANWLAALLFTLSAVAAIVTTIYNKKLRDQFTLQQGETIRLNDSIQAQIKLVEDHKTTSKTLETKVNELLSQRKLLETDLDHLQKNIAKVEAEKRTIQRSVQTIKPEALQAEVVGFLSLLQKQGRFLDFIMGDISKYPDDKVGAAARIVHQGCLKVLDEYFDMSPVYTTDEGAIVSITSDDNPRSYTILGKGGDSLPLKGKLVHKGWKTNRVNLPTRASISDADRTIIAPAELELTN
jgi:hypothetical protein